MALYQNTHQGVVSGERDAGLSDATRAAITASAVRKVFAGHAADVVALDGVSVTIPEGEFFTLLGPSGCGKTTLLRLIAGFEEPTSGSILLDGEELAGRPPHHRPVNTVFQSYALFPHMTVAENIAFGLKMRRLPSAEIGARVADMLDLVQLSGMAGRTPGQLSGGQQQRIALARALANRPRVLLLDEPLSALDFKLRKEMRLELKRIQRDIGITFIFVTHDQQEALEMSDRIAVMADGRIQQVDTPEMIYQSPASRFVADFIGETNFLDIEALDHAQDRTICRIVGGATLEILGSTAVEPPATLAVRPEGTILLPPGTRDMENLLNGRITDRVYQGTQIAYYVEIAGGQRIVGSPAFRDHEPLSFTIGDAVSIHVPARAARVLSR